MTRLSTQDPSQRKVRTRSRLSAKLERNVSAYAFAAGSAGVALLASVQPAEAKIVSTKVHLIVPTSGPARFDINHDGQYDFALSNVNFMLGATTCTSANGARQKPGRQLNSPPLGCGPFDFGLQVSPLHAANEVWQSGTSYGKKCAADVKSGVNIGPKRPFAAGPLVMSGLSGTSEGHPFCPWAFPHHPFLGVKFVDKAGRLHYGWVRVSVQTDYSTVIEEYAYETIPNKPIPAGTAKGGDSDSSALDQSTSLVPKAPEPATFGRLAQGASGLAAWRRKDEVLATL